MFAHLRERAGTALLEERDENLRAAIRTLSDRSGTACPSLAAARIDRWDGRRRQRRALVVAPKSSF